MRPKPVVLVVHGDQEARDRISSRLAEHAYEPIAAGDLGTALDQVRRYRPAVILWGDMPDIGEDVLMEHLAVDKSTSTIPVVSIASATGRHGRSNHAGNGVVGLDEDPDALLRSIRLAIEGQPAHRKSSTVSPEPVRTNGTKPARPNGSRGFVVGLSLATVLQMLQLEHASYDLEVVAGEQRGLVRVDGGELVDASHGAAAGEDAIFDILQWESPQVEIKDPTPFERRIVTSLAHLLMESVRRQDEAMPQPDAEPDAGEDLDILASAKVAEATDPFGDSPIDPALLNDLLTLGGLLALAVVDGDLERCWVLGETVPGQVDASVVLLTDLARANISFQKRIAPEEVIEDILVTTPAQYHLARLLGGESPILVCAAFDRERANLAMIRRRFAQIEAPVEN